ncbi:hypothetical protein MG293_001735 [Ovis ammon polii]|uniref:Uncharacterized protein n=1 Tax=Ovis ammon polii TaxID=230172 RepID=A0AAD4URJ4_OVIAM|nr:hypothetical protein MG293_001735 [Ovis ammon polii]
MESGETQVAKVSRTLVPERKEHQREQAAAAVKSRQSCPTLCDHMDSSLQGSAVPGILQARTLEWAAISTGY